LAARADVLAEQGLSAPGSEVLRGDGAVSSRQARCEARRSKVAAYHPTIGAALSSGETSAAHVDVIADLTRHLSDEQRQRLDLAAVLAKARSLPVETFRTSLRRAIDEIRGDHGLDTRIER
jgi:hypothetical protein